MINIAMVEDDAELAEVLTQYLSKFNIKVTNYEEPFLALSSLRINKYDLIILDLTLPGMDGLDVCKLIVKDFNIPIIISSARSDITDKVTALQLGADDYLPKPYDLDELFEKSEFDNLERIDIIPDLIDNQRIRLKKLPILDKQISFYRFDKRKISEENEDGMNHSKIWISTHAVFMNI